MKNKTRELAVVYQATSALVPYKGNPRTHSNQQLRQIAKSIQEFSFCNPVLIDKNNTVIAGHGCLDAAKLLGIYLELGCISKLQAYLEEAGIRSKKRISKTGKITGGVAFGLGALYEMLHNPVYLGKISHKGTLYPGRHPAILDQEIWDRVQARLSSNLQAPRSRLKAKETALLLGLLYDEEGNPFTPSHTYKKGKRYRYYVSARGKGGDRKRFPTRIPANEIEELVVAQLNDLLHSPRRILQALNLSSHSDFQEHLQAIRRFTETKPDLRRFLRPLVMRVSVQRGKVEVQISLKQLAIEVLGPDFELDIESDLLKIPVETHLSRQRGEMSFVFPAGSSQIKSQSAPALIRAVGRAHSWVGRILRGEALNQRAIAEELGLNERYVSRIIPLAFLAPDLTEQILQGNHAQHLSLKTFPADIPAAWAEQRAWLRARGPIVIEETEESDQASKISNDFPSRGNPGQLQFSCRIHPQLTRSRLQ